MITKEKVKALWKLCFDDTDEYIEMYFSLRYNNDINTVIVSGNEVIAALQMIPYPMTFCGKKVDTSYISGACTHPDFRGRGVMQQLLSQAFLQMLQNGIYFSTLIPAEPWLFDYYARMGYAPVFQYATTDIVLPEFLPSTEITVDTLSGYQEEVYAYLDKKLSERPCCIQHTAEDFRVVMADLAISRGSLFVSKQNDEINGIAIVYKGEKILTINELLADTKEAEQSLLCYIEQHTGYKHIIRILPLNDEQPRHALGMARIIKAKEVLQAYAAVFPEEEMQIELTDKQLPANNGYYYLYKGKCMYSAERLPGAHITMNINELTGRILGQLHPYMSLMLN